MPIKEVVKKVVKNGANLLIDNGANGLKNGGKIVTRGTKRPALDSPEIKPFIDDLKLGKNRPGKKLIFEEEQLDGTLLELELESAGANRGLRWTDSKRHQRRAKKSDKSRERRINEQTDPNRNKLDFETRWADENRLQGEVYEMHHIQGLKDADFLYKGLKKEDQARMTKVIEEIYGLYMGNHRGNAASLIETIHKDMHRYGRKYFGEQPDISKLSFEERLPFLEAFAKRQQHLHRMMFAFWQDELHGVSEQTLKDLDVLLKDVRSA